MKTSRTKGKETPEPFEPTIFELSRPGRRGLEMDDGAFAEVPKEIPTALQRHLELRLPEVSEPEVVRHFVRLSRANYHLDLGIYPLGSCTMKHNPRVNERLARLPGFLNLHPLQPASTVQGALRLMKALEEALVAITGMDAASLQPAAGAQGELTALLMIRRYHADRGNPRKVVLVPDSAHGTNPASTTLAGYESVSVPSTPEGLVDLKALRERLNEDVAALMITNPNTLGLFEVEIREIVEAVHGVGALVYMDGANLNAILGYVRPGDIGVDAMHINLHKTFSTPHGGGGPGAGPVVVKAHLAPYLPLPRIVEEEDGSLRLSFEGYPASIGKVLGFWGHFLVMVRAYAYIRRLGPEGLKEVAENAVLNANYLFHLIRDLFEPASPLPPMHEFVVSLSRLKKETGVRAIDVAKRLLDYGVYAPTVYFPLIVPEAFMVEPTETETRETLERFAQILREVVREARERPEVVKEAPHTTPVRRLNEARAARELVIRE